MKNTTPLDANALLALPVYRAGELFAGTSEEMKTLYRRLVGRWHPDHSSHPKAHDVFIHLTGLYEAASRRRRPLVDLNFIDEDGRQFRFIAQTWQQFELGKAYRGKASVAYRVEHPHRHGFDAYCQQAARFLYASDKMKQQISPALPIMHAAHWGDEGGLIVVKRDPDGVSLRDFLDHLNLHHQELDPRHVGWILNGLHNLACYLAYAKTAHHGIGLDTVWINPQRHSVQLLGGWFHALPYGQPIHTLPAFSAAFAPRSYLQKKTASGRLDMECIRAIGRMLLGDPSGSRMHITTPSPMVTALRLPATGTAVEEYQRWKQALLASFGAPKFVSMEISHKDIYQGE